jgi:NAD(P)-dependent dehydrogenase (short-subunit alcohol dehydrogenase family)
LVGKVALVTGAGSGIGRSSAQRLAAEGATVVVADLNLDGAHETVRLITDAGGAAKAAAVDVSSADSLERLIIEIDKDFGRLDIAHNNAGIDLDRHPRVVETSEEEWARIISINLKGIWLSLRAELPVMTRSGGGAIINTSSSTAFRATRGMGPYSASKAGVVMLTKTAALEHASDGIRVNAIAAGPVRTPLIQRSFDLRPEVEEMATTMIPMGRISDPSEIASIVAWLASDDASFVTGTVVVADGGLLA